MKHDSSIIERVRLFRTAVSMAVLGIVVALFCLPASAVADTPDWTRLGGDTRYDTMSDIADAGFSGTGADTVVVTCSKNFPDALSAAATAGLEDAPILLTDSAKLSPQVSSRVAALGAQHVVIVGGTGVVSTDVERSLRAVSGVTTCTRIAGADRFATARSLFENGKGSWGNTAIVATGLDFPDSLSASPLSYAGRAPIFLTGAGGVLDDASLSALKSGHFSRVLIVGGTNAVSSATESACSALSGVASVERLAGPDRYATSAAIADYALSHALLGCTDVAIATGTNYPDSISGGALAGNKGSVLLLADNHRADNAHAFLKAHESEVRAGYFLGGEYAVTRYVETKILNIWDASVAIEPPVNRPAPGEYQDLVDQYLAEYIASGNNYSRGMQTDYDTFGNYLYVSRYKEYPAEYWTFTSDDGTPPKAINDGEWVYNPVCVDQYVLYLHGKYVDDIAAGADAAQIAQDRSKLITSADFLLGTQGSDGAFRYSFNVGYYLPQFCRFDIGWVNSMAQGQAISALGRVYDVTGDRRYLDAADAAYAFMDKTQQQGGCRSSLYYLGNYDEGRAYVTYEYQPIRPNAYTLNSFMYTMLGLYDLSQVPESAYAAQASSRLDQCLVSLKIMLPYYDLHGFAAYDLNFITNDWDEPFIREHYMANDIFVLNALYNICGDETIGYYRDRFISYVPR